MLRIYRSVITPTPRRRDAERDVTGRLIKEAFGQDATLNHDPDGRPQLTGVPLDASDPLHISLSHSRTEAVLAVCDMMPVGIDIESWRPALRTTLAKWLTPAERAYINTDAELLRAWTAKEAMFKALPAPQPVSLLEVSLTDTRFTVNHITEGTGDEMTDIAVALLHG
ncbi:MAG: 4'-phosphopantetheinyl transferase superfamily protein [Candidatus Amulumruptor caecigallinarius]|nr:4'-phosphopantetheinyl transferase superfamily protein [Candidatus Amulumruptor caecigallinarius]MCM1396460.1 4'-phosphopantetheinyl transferase superfamily protein [Candidatus Amulumruptor caecigallinarius]MCM1453483.1 4'-phosphopantetheinyl transferase superfamily protein [bacterium]